MAIDTTVARGTSRRRVLVWEGMPVSVMRHCGRPAAAIYTPAMLERNFQKRYIAGRAAL